MSEIVTALNSIMTSNMKAAIKTAHEWIDIDGNGETTNLARVFLGLHIENANLKYDIKRSIRTCAELRRRIRGYETKQAAIDSARKKP